MSLCGTIRRHLLEHRPLDDEALQRHLTDCAACAAMVEAGPMLGPPDGSAQALAPPPTLFASIEASLSREHGPRAWLRERPTVVRLALLGSLGALVLLLQLVLIRKDWALYPSSRMVASLGLFILLAGWGLAWALRPLHRPPLSVGATGLAVLLLLAVPFVLALMPAVHTGHPSSIGGTGDHLLPSALSCIGHAAAFTVPVILLMTSLNRTPGRFAILLLVGVAAAGALGNAVLLVHCPLTAPAHLLAGHASAGPILIGLWLVAARLMYRRPAVPA